MPVSDALKETALELLLRAGAVALPPKTEYAEVQEFIEALTIGVQDHYGDKYPAVGKFYWGDRVIVVDEVEIASCYSERDIANLLGLSIFQEEIIGEPRLFPFPSNGRIDLGRVQNSLFVALEFDGTGYWRTGLYPYSMVGSLMKWAIEDRSHPDHHVTLAMAHYLHVDDLFPVVRWNGQNGQYVFDKSIRPLSPLTEAVLKEITTSGT